MNVKHTTGPNVVKEGGFLWLNDEGGKCDNALVSAGLDFDFNISSERKDLMGCCSVEFIVHP